MFTDASILRFSESGFEGCATSGLGGFSLFPVRNRVRSMSVPCMHVGRGEPVELHVAGARVSVWLRGGQTNVRIYFS